MSKKEVATVETKELVAFEAPEFEQEAINTDDVEFPRIQIMQPISESVTDGQYVAGDIINSMTGEKIGDSKEPIEIYPLRSRKYYIVKDIDADKFVRIEPITCRNDMDKPWNFEENGAALKRQPCMEVFVMAPKWSDLPFVLRFKGMSYKNVAKTFNTMAFMLPAAQRKAPFVRSLNILTKKEKNEKGTYFVFSFSVGKLTDAATYALCNDWYVTTKTKTVKLDDEEFKPSSSTGEETPF